MSSYKQLVKGEGSHIAERGESCEDCLSSQRPPTKKEALSGRRRQVLQPKWQPANVKGQKPSLEIPLGSAGTLPVHGGQGRVASLSEAGAKLGSSSKNCHMGRRRINVTFQSLVMDTAEASQFGISTI